MVLVFILCGFLWLNFLADLLKASQRPHGQLSGSKKFSQKKL